MSRVRPSINMRCGLSRLVPRMVPPTVRMPDERGFVELQPPIFHQAAEAVAEADDFHAVKAERGFADAADGGVQAGAVAACRQDADAFRLCHRRCETSNVPPAVERNF